jgi:hypothetical protein
MCGKGFCMKNNLLRLGIMLLLLTGCQKDQSDESGTATIKIRFQLLAFGQPIDTTRDYTNFSGEIYRVSKFKFYASGFELQNTANAQTTKEKESYHLVDLEDPASQVLTITFSGGNYDRLNFIVGVDSLRNVSGAQAGALDPANGMFWTWNTGYIFAKFEGRSPASTAPFNAFTFHIGGFRTGENAIRLISLPAQVEVGKTREVIIDVNAEKWFDGVQQLSIAAGPAVMSPGGAALDYADNYAVMFSVNQVINP